MICSSQRTGGAFQPRPYERRSDLSAAWGLATSTTLFFNGLFFCPFCHPTKLFLFSAQDSGCFATFVCGVQRRSAPWPPREQEQNLPEKQAFHSDFTLFPGVLNYYNIIYPSTEGLFRILQQARQAPQVSPSYTLQRSASDSCSGSLPAERYKPASRIPSSFPSPPRIQ